MNLTGLDTYRREYMMYRLIDNAVPWTNRGRTPENQQSELTEEQIRAARARVDQLLQEAGGGADILAAPYEGLPLSRVSADQMTIYAVEKALGEQIPGYRRQIAAASATTEAEFLQSRAYRGLSEKFEQLSGISAETGARIEDGTRRIPVSPYDPRWSGQVSRVGQGRALLSVPTGQIPEGTALSSLHLVTSVQQLMGSTRQMPPTQTQVATPAPPAVPQVALGNGLDRYFHEFAFERSLEMIPTWVNRTLPEDQHVQPLTASQGRHLRSELGRVLDEQGLSMDATAPEARVAIFRNIDRVFLDNIPGYRPMHSSMATQGLQARGFQALHGRFLTMTGRNFNEAGYAAPAGVGGPRIPISPYDPRWADRETVREHGTRPLVALLETTGELDDYGRLVDLDFPLHEGVPREGRDGLKEAGASRTTGDVTGLARLRHYMTAAEYREAEPWVRAGVTADGTIDPSLTMTPEAMGRATAILDYLNDEGLDYRIENDIKQGQIKARVAGSRMEIRLTDTRENERWVGRVYEDGVWTTLRSASATSNPSARQGERAPEHVPTAEQAVDLVRFGLGGDIMHRDGAHRVGEVRPRGDRVRERQVSYHTAGGLTCFLSNDLFIKQDTRQRTSSVTWFNGPDDATEWLENAVSTAQAKVREELDVEGLIEEARELADDPEHVPILSGTEELMALRQDYWEVLRGEEIDLLHPDHTREEYEQAIRDGDYEAVSRMTTAMVAPTPADQVRAHSELVVSSMIGTLDKDPETGLRFDPAKVASYMESEGATWRNSDNLVAALRRAEIPAEELKGEGFFNTTITQRLIRFDEASATDMLTHPDPMVTRMGQVISDSITRNAAEVRSIVIDDNGIVTWQAERRFGRDDDRTLVNGVEKGARTRYVTGQIGQIFSRGERGEVVTRFAGGDNHLFVPGYEAYVSPQKPGENKTLEERTRLRGYEQVLAESLRRQVTSDILEIRSEVGQPTSINGTYRRLYDTRYPVDYFEKAAEVGLDPKWQEAIIATGALRVRYPNTFRDGSTAMPALQAEKRGLDRRNDNTRDPFVLSGGRNLSQLDTQAGAGYFDPMMTGMAGNQGVVRYLNPTATINEQGYVEPGDPAVRVPVAAHEESWAMGFDPHDRQNMTYSNLMQASGVTGGVRTAMTQFGGWNFEDGIIVSRQFSEEHLIRDTGGQPRPLKVGDKLSDFHGNKGVISLVVDPEMSMEQAQDEGIADQVQFFRDNADLNVVLSPFSAISRFNGGTAREMMQDAGPLTMRDAEGNPREVPGGSGNLNFIVTHMAVDAKTNVYDAQAMREGRGRKASSQLAWALQAQGCQALFQDFYGSNTMAVSNFQEYMVALGMDVTAYGELSREWTEDTRTNRRVFEASELRLRPMRGNELYPRLDLAPMKKDFAKEISVAGGMMEVPFPLTLGTGDQTPEVPGKPGTYLLPVLSSHLRSEQDLSDGTVSRHDHTTRYMRIFEAATKYRYYTEQLAHFEGSGNTRKIEELTREIAATKRSAHSSCAQISSDIISRRIETKDNIFKESLMTHRQPHSATAVWTADPRLGVDQVAMNASMAHELGVNKNGYALVWRDPVLRDGGVRYMRVAIDNSLEGVAVNPVAVKSFDGDFDGDSVGLVGNLSPEAHAEALERLTIEANILDYDSGERQPDGTMAYQLSLHDSLDTRVHQHVDASAKENMEVIVSELNRYEQEYRAGEITREQLLSHNRDHMEDLNEFYRGAFANKESLVTLRFDSMESHMDSVAHCYRTGAKGSEGKLRDYAEYIGADPEAGFRDTGMPDPEAMQPKYAGSQQATALKTQFTGVAGKKSQEAVMLLRASEAMKAATGASYPATQSILQAKHDPEDAIYRANTLSEPAQHLWEGRLLTRETNPETGRYDWEPARDEKGRFVQADKARWVEQYRQMYSDDQGMGVHVNVEQVEQIAELLSDETGRMRPMDRENWQSWPEEVRPLPLDQLAYSDNKGKFDHLMELAEQRENIFKGLNVQFAPKSVQKNLDLVKESKFYGIESFDEVGFEPISARDTRVDYRHKVGQSQLRVARNNEVHSMLQQSAQTQVLEPVPALAVEPVSTPAMTAPAQSPAAATAPVTIPAETPAVVEVTQAPATQPTSQQVPRDWEATRDAVRERMKRHGEQTSAPSAGSGPEMGG